MKRNRSIIAAGIALTGVCATSAGASTAASQSTSPTAGSQRVAANARPFTVGYDIKIHTADVNYAGTDGDVRLRVNGAKRSTQFWYLDDSADNYERNRTDHFLRSGTYVGSLRSVTVCFDPLGGANAEWLPDRIIVNGVVFPRSPNTDWFMKGQPSCKTFSA